MTEKNISQGLKLDMLNFNALRAFMKSKKMFYENSKIKRAFTLCKEI